MLEQIFKELDRKLGDSHGTLWSITINRMNNDANIQITDDADGEGNMIVSAFVQHAQCGDRDSIEICAEKIMKQLA